MESTVAVQTNGLGFSFQAARNSSIAAIRVVDAQEGIAADALVGQLGEPAFNQVQPTATGGNIVHHKAGMSVEPSLHLGGAMSAVVVHDQVQRRLAGKLAIDAAQELQKLLMPVTLVAVADDFALRARQARRTESSFRSACSRESWFRSGPSSAAGRAGCDSEPEFGSSRRRRAPSPGREDSDKGRPRR